MMYTTAAFYFFVKLIAKKTIWGVGFGGSIDGICRKKQINFTFNVV